jgi:hypothetical protein
MAVSGRRGGRRRAPPPDQRHAPSLPRAEPVAGVPVSAIDWAPCVRIVPSRYPPVDLFERVADPADFEAVYEVEALTNDRLRAEVGEIALVPPAERVFGPGSSYIMAPFTHLAPGGGRYTDGTYGAYYTASDRATAVAETCYHRARFMAATAEPPLDLEMRVLEARLSAELHDVRGMVLDRPELYLSEEYRPPQELGRTLRYAGSSGVVYRSVRRAGGECAAVFRPRVLSECRQAEHLIYVWDGHRIAAVYEKRLYRP